MRILITSLLFVALGACGGAKKAAPAPSSAAPPTTESQEQQPADDVAPDADTQADPDEGGE